MRLEVAAECPAPLAQFLLQQFGLTEADLYRCDGPVNIARLSSLADQVDIDALKYEPFVPGVPARLQRCARHPGRDPRARHPAAPSVPVVRAGGRVHPRAAEDADVVAIKQTVYRTGVNSVLMEALIEAARRGKEVTVVVELMARFDEEANINWAERLERAGAQVVYGVFGLKTHAKLALLIRRERDARGRARLVPYAHLGTGNYHPRTTRLYTDFGLLTADPEICADVNEVFLHITSLAKAAKLKRLLLAPFTMHRRVLDMIRREIRHARDGRPARIIAKMNALVEDGVIRALYAASAAGVKIDLIVRGACALRPGRARHFGEHPGALDPRPLPRAPPRLVLRERRRAGRLARVGRLDGPQPVPPRGGRVSGAATPCCASGSWTRGSRPISPTTARRGNSTPRGAGPR